MNTRQLGQSELQVTPITFGCWAISGGGDITWGDQDEQQAIEAIHAALDVGINSFDTAEAYGNGSSEVLLGKALGSRRRDVVVMTKLIGNNLRPDKVSAACEASLARLGTDYIDLYQIHWPERDVPVADTMAALVKLRDQGKVRAVGVSNFGVRLLAEVPPAHGCVSNQIVYSLLTRAIEFDIRDACISRNIGILCYSPLAQGLLTGKFRSVEDVPPGRRRTRHFAGHHSLSRHEGPGCEAATFAAIAAVHSICERVGRPMAEVALAWAMAQPGVTSVIAGARNAAQVHENVKSAARTLDRAILAELDVATAEVKRQLGNNPDLWAKASRIS